MTFTPLWDDTHPCRILTLLDDDVPVPIGRASKREAKKRSPAKDNGWFDSRVMSRDHALVSLSRDKDVGLNLGVSDALVTTFLLMHFIESLHSRLWFDSRNIPQRLQACGARGYSTDEWGYFEIWGRCRPW